VKPGDLIELRIGKGFSYLYNEEGFKLRNLWEKGGHAMLVLGEVRWGRVDLLKVIHPEGIGYIDKNQVQKAGEPNPWPVVEDEDDDDY
jgi:hypothetical protein